MLAIDLGEDKQVAAVVDHEGRVLARKTVRAKAYQLGELLAWAAGKAAAARFAGLVVACEPTGHRWKAVMGLADAAGHGFVCVQSLAVARAREGLYPGQDRSPGCVPDRQAGDPAGVLPAGAGR